MRCSSALQLELLTAKIPMLRSQVVILSLSDPFAKFMHSCCAERVFQALHYRSSPSIKIVP